MMVPTRYVAQREIAEGERPDVPIHQYHIFDYSTADEDRASD